MSCQPIVRQQAIGRCSCCCTLLAASLAHLASGPTADRSPDLIQLSVPCVHCDCFFHRGTLQGSSPIEAVARGGAARQEDDSAELSATKEDGLRPRRLDNHIGLIIQTLESFIAPLLEEQHRDSDAVFDSVGGYDLSIKYPCIDFNRDALHCQEFEDSERRNKGISISDVAASTQHRCRLLKHRLLLHFVPEFIVGIDQPWHSSRTL